MTSLPFFYDLFNFQDFEFLLSINPERFKLFSKFLHQDVRQAAQMCVTRCLTSVTFTSCQTGSSFSFKKGKSQELDFCAKWKGQGRSFFMAHCLTSVTSTSGQTGSSFSFKKGKSQELDSCIVQDLCSKEIQNPEK